MDITALGENTKINAQTLTKLSFISQMKGMTD